MATLHDQTRRLKASHNILTLMTVLMMEQNVDLDAKYTNPIRASVIVPRV